MPEPRISVQGFAANTQFLLFLHTNLLRHVCVKSSQRLPKHCGSIDFGVARRLEPIQLSR